MRKYLYTLYLFIIAASLSGQSIIKLASPVSQGENLSSCNGFSLQPGFSFKASSGNSLNLKIDKLTCEPWVHNIIDYNNDGYPDSYTIDKQREVGEIPFQSSFTPAGSLTYSVPIEIYPGRSNMQPNISLIYNSFGRNGVAGMGWNIGGLSSINITNSSIYYDNKVKAASCSKESAYTLDGVRLINLGEGKYQSEQGNIVVKNYASSNLYYFEVFYPNGNKATYGYKSSIAKISYPLTRMEDRLGNYIEYKYDERNSIYYISQISYGANTSSGHFASVKFLYDNRSDVTSVYIDGLEIKQDKILKQIEAYFNSTLLKSYVLGHEEKETAFLRQIDCVADGKTVNPLTFYYGTGTSSSMQALQASISTFHKSNASNWRAARFNLNANDGLIATPGNSDKSIYGKIRTKTTTAGEVYYEFGSTFNETDKLIVYPSLSGEMNSNNKTIDLGANYQGCYVVDYDGDGNSEFLRLNYDYSNPLYPVGSFLNITKYKYNSNNNTFAEKTFVVFLGHNEITDGDFKSPLWRSYCTGDFTGDGKDDLLIIAYGIDFKGRTTTSYQTIVDLDKEEIVLGTSSLLDIRPTDGVFAADYDGDGKAEVWYHKGSTMTIYNVNISTNKFEYLTSTTVDLSKKEKILPGDFNADGLTDFIISPGLSTKGRRAVHEGPCGGCCSTLAFSLDNVPDNIEFPFLVKSSSCTSSCMLVLDDKWVVDYGTIWTICYSKGKDGFTRQNVSLDRYASDSYYALQDMDNDGCVDLLKQEGQNVQVHLIKKGLIDRTASLQFQLPAFTLGSYVAGDISNHRQRSHYIFVSNEGKVYAYYDRRSQQQEGLLTNSVSSLGVIRKHTFRELKDDLVYQNNITPQSGYALLAGHMFLLNQTDILSNNTAISSEQYRYKNGLYSKEKRGFAGFQQIHITDNTREIATVQTFDPTNFGVLKETDSPLASATYNYTISVGAVNNRIAKITLDNKTEKDKLKDISVTSTYLYDSYENPIKETINFGGGITTVTETKSKNIDTSTLYLLGLPEEQSVTNTRGGTSVVTKTIFTYNDKYLPESKIGYYNANQTAEETYEYDAAWNLKESKSRSYTATNWIVDTYAYDSYGRISKKTNPIGLYVEYGYNAKGLLETAKNHKGHIIKTEYDRWGKSIKTTYPDGVVETNTLAWATSPVGALIVSTTTATGQPDAQVYADALGREIRTGEKRFDNQYLYTDKVYDNKGRLEKISLPFKGTSTGLWNKYAYDNYDRIITLTYASGKKDSYSYVKNKVTSVIDNVKTDKVYDASGLVISVTDPAGTITYNYRPDGQYSSIVAPGSITTSFGYDSYGRQTSIADPSAGTKTFAHDAAGNINYEKDAKGKITNMFYDSYNRMEKKEVVGEQTVSYKYNPDNGELSSVSSTNGTETAYAYDNLLRLSEEKETVVDGKWLQKTFSYANGNLSSIFYKSQSGDIVTENYTYTNGHHTETKLNNTTSVWKLTAENTMGMPTASTTGVLSRTYGYDNYGLPTARVIKNGTTVIQDFGYNFSTQKGNLNWRKDNTRNIQENFDYDELNRLTTINNTSSVAYDIKGNITSKAGVGNTFEYNHPTKPYAVTDITPGTGIRQISDSIVYNNMMRPSLIYETPTTFTSFTYNGDADRVKMHVKNNGADQLQRYYMGGQYEVDVRPTGTEERLYLDGDAYSAVSVYVRQGTGAWAVQYIGRDYLGSITHVTDATGVVKQELSYDPWGRLRNPVTQALYDIDNRLTLVLGDRGYTGHEHLASYGLINMNARLYDPVVGRFLSPDPYVQAPFMSQNFNRYSYGLNNPLRYTDESGEFWQFVAGAILGGTINVVVNWNNIGSFGQGLSYFGVGAAGGALMATGSPLGIVAGGALMAGGNSALTQGYQNGFNNINWNQVGSASILGGGLAYAGYGIGSYFNSVFTPMFSSVGGPAIQQGLAYGASGAATGFTMGTGMSLIGGQSLGDALKNGGYSAGIGFAGGLTFGMINGYQQAKGLNVNPWTNKSLEQGLQPYYPANDGAVAGSKTSEYLMPGDKIDRYGHNYGKFFSEPGTPAPMRALPPGNSGDHNVYQVVKPIPVVKSTIAPAFNQPGGGVQYQTPVNVNTLLNKGFIIKF